jgi:phospholipase D1/2
MGHSKYVYHLSFFRSATLRLHRPGHPIADVHPGDIDATIFPGADYNNSRIYDFDNVQEWEKNKLDRTKSSRMGWTDVAVSLNGPITGSLVHHFKDRW